MSAQPPVARESYLWHWLVLVGVIAGTAFLLNSRRDRNHHLPPPLVSPANGVDWFLVLRMPEVPPLDEEIEAAKAQVDSWLSGLTRAGFVPMRLSTVLAQLEQGKKLPRKTMVLLFQPGYRRTHETLAPILEQHRIPAVWMTDHKAVKQSDRRYLSQHVLGQMRRSGLWDVAWYHGAGDASLAFEFARAGTPGSRGKLSINRVINHTALNRGLKSGELYRLNVNPIWTSQELVDRLLAEVPVEGPSYLTARRIENRIWGIAMDEGTAAQQSLLVQPSSLERTVAISWPCTMGQHDLLLNMNLASRSGELWISLRAARSVGQGIRVGFTDEGILVDQYRQPSPVRLTTMPWPVLPQQRFSATIVLQGQRFQLFLNDEPVLSLSTLDAPATTQGIVELEVHDKIRGAAAAEITNLVFVPLKTPQVDGSTWKASPPGRVGSPPPAGRMPLEKF